MSAPIPKNLPLIRARDLEQPRDTSASGIALKGRLAHFRGIGTTTLASILVSRMHADQLPVAWISATTDTVYPPDLADNGVDLDSLIFVMEQDSHRAARAAEHLLRSSSFSLLILDLEEGADIPDALQGRLLRLARKTDAAVVFLTHAKSSLRGSMISLRGDVARVPLIGGGYRLRIHITRDKHGGPGVRSGEVCYAPPGMH